MFCTASSPPEIYTLSYTTLFRSLRRDGRLEVWELVPGRECRPLPHTAGSVDFRADGRRLASAGRDVVCWDVDTGRRSEEHTSELQSHVNLVCRLMLEKKTVRCSS